MAVSQRFIGYIEAETGRAFLFRDHFWEKPDWMPKSQITTVRDPDSMEVTLEASAWICGQKQIKEFEEVLNAE